jgi:aryl-alcohol dehydrogenase-like predicted oxidoreductase
VKTRLGLGTRDLRRDDAAVVEEAIGAGVDFVDVSPEWGETEALVGRLLREQRARHRVTVATAVVGPLLKSVERSLRATRLEALPLAQVEQSLVTGRDAPQALGLMTELVRRGDVVRWGVLVRTPDEIGGLLELPVIEWVQVEHHLPEPGAAPAIARASEAKRGVIARRPLDGGALDVERALDFVCGGPVDVALIGMRKVEHLRQNQALLA